MNDWRQRAHINADVVYFDYSNPGMEKNVDEVYVWDLDKTYLDTRWGNVKELLKTAMERAFQKRNIPGTSTLIQTLQASWVEKKHNNQLPIYFITASPPQMEGKIREKLLLDGIRAFGCFYKDNLQNIRPKRFWRLTNQIGFKLQAMLQLRMRLKDDVRQVLWGDDSEADAIIYNLYSDICARRIDESELQKILKALHVVGEQTENILLLQAKIPVCDPVEKIYINLASDTDPEYYIKFGRRTIPTYNSMQVAVDLFQDSRLGEQQVVRIAQDLIMNYGFSNEELAQSFDDMVRRQILAKSTVERLLPLLKKGDYLSINYEPSVAAPEIVKQVGERIFELQGVHEPWVPERIDYLHDYR